MPFEPLIARYGLLAVGLGAGIEGETVVMAGGLLARQHLIALPGVTIAAMLGSFLADQGFFLIGRHLRDRRFVKKLLDRPGAHRAMTLLERHPDRFILSIRFLYGIRTVSPIAVGTSHITRRRFLLLNAIAAIVWALLFTGIGYEIGGQWQAILQHLPPVRHVVPALVSLAAGALLSFRLIGRRFHHRTVARAASPAP